MSTSIDRSACILVPETTYATNGSTSPMRVCVIDLGTNSFHAIIVDAHANGSYQIVDRMKEMVRLGQHGLSANTLPEEAMERGMKALNRIHLLAKGWDTDEYLAFATSAIREATNGGEFIRRVRNALGLRIRPISGEQEAGLIYRGVRRAVEIDAPTLLVDIGGGSVEFIVAAGGEQLFARSLKLGAARMTERFVNSDPLSDEQEQALREHYVDTMSEVLEACRSHDVTSIVGSSGTMKSLARVALSDVENGNQTVFQRTFEVPPIQAALSRIIASSADERMAHEAIDPKRVDQIGAGAVLLDTILEHLPAVDQVRVSSNALREGMVVHFMDTNYTRLRQIAPFRTPRRRSVHELAYRYNWEERHAQHAAATSTFLFDVCRPIYDGPDEDIELLEYAALLHDVGHLVSHDTHAKHSRYLIKNANLQGFQPDEIAIMSLVARYHRGRAPKASDSHYRTQSANVKRRVRQLASLVRIAEGLDRSHFQNVTALRARLTEEALKVSIATKGDPQLEVWSGGEEGAMFEEEFGRSLQVTPTSIDVQPTDEPDPSVSHATVSAPEAAG